MVIVTSPVAQMIKTLPANVGDVGLIPGLSRFPGGGHGNPLHGVGWEFHGQRSLAGCSPWGCKESDTTDRLTLSQQIQSLFVLTGLCVCAKLLQSCPTLCDPVDCSPSGFSVHGILQTRILEWVAMPSFKGSSQPRDWTWVPCVSCIAGRFFIADLPGKSLFLSLCL